MRHLPFHEPARAATPDRGGACDHHHARRLPAQDRPPSGIPPQRTRGTPAYRGHPMVRFYGGQNVGAAAQAPRRFTRRTVHSNAASRRPYHCRPPAERRHTRWPGHACRGHGAGGWLLTHGRFAGGHDGARRRGTRGPGTCTGRRWHGPHAGHAGRRAAGCRMLCAWRRDSSRALLCGPRCDAMWYSARVRRHVGPPRRRRDDAGRLAARAHDARRRARCPNHGAGDHPRRAAAARRVSLPVVTS